MGEATPPQEKVEDSALQAINVKIDDEVQNFSESPVIVDGSTLVPMRAIFEKLGAAIEWDNDARKVKGTKGNRSVVLAIDSASTVINNKATTLDVKPIIVNETTMVPIRVVSESLGAKVEWDNETRTVSIISSN